jgi:hypothetical protein
VPGPLRGDAGADYFIILVIRGAERARESSAGAIHREIPAAEANLTGKKIGS